MRDRLEMLTRELIADPCEATLMPVVSRLIEIHKTRPRAEYVERSAQVLQIDDIGGEVGVVGPLLASMLVLTVVRLHAAAPSDEHYLAALKAWARECVRQGDVWLHENENMMREIIETRAELQRVAGGPISGPDEVEGYPLIEDADELDAAIEEARKDPRWPDISAVISVLQKKVRF